MEVRLVVDRIVGDKAVLLFQPEEKEKLHWPMSLLPGETKESDILKIKIEIDREKTEKTKEEVRNLIDKLRKKND